MEQEPLTDEELRAIRNLLEAERRMVWLRSSLRVWASYIAAGVLTGFALWKALTEYIAIKVGIR